jgi:hypothetical protein
MPRSVFACILVTIWLYFSPVVFANPPLSPGFIAAQINPDNVAAIPRGSSAIGGLDDWLLSNGILCATISDPSHETYLSYRGGTLIDLGYCGRNDDQWNSYHELFNLGREKILPATSIETHTTDHDAVITVKGKMAGVENQTTYRLNREHPEELSIETTLTRVEKSDALDLFGALILHPHRSLTPFVISTHSPQYSKGFHHPYADHNDKLGMMKLMTPADLHVLVGSPTITPEISYGVLSESIELVTKSGTHKPLRQFAINDDEFTLIGNFTNALWFDTDGQPGLLQFLQTRMMDLDIGDTLVAKKRILVSPVADVASITNHIYTGKILHGTISNPADRLLVTDSEHHPLSFIKPDATGAFEFRAPQTISKIILIVQQANRDNALELTVDLDTTSTVSVQSPPQMRATVQLPVGHIMRLVFKGAHGTPDPVFFADTLDFRVGNHRYKTDLTGHAITLAGIAADIKQISIPPGDYTVYSTRGLEYSLSKTTLHLDAGDNKLLTIDVPQHVVQMPGWMSGDFHVHSEFSFDSTLPAQRRVIDFVAQGANIMVSTEHKRTINYQPIVELLGLQKNIVAVSGVELTGMAHTEKIPRTMGHSNVFPVTADERLFEGGTLPHENRRLGEVIEEYKQRYPDLVFQLNHPRIHGEPNDDIYFFDHLSINKRFDSSLPLDNPQNSSLIEKLAGSDYRDIDFDAMELMNGQEMNAYEQVRNDWFALLKQGYRKTGTADSDSHTSGEVVALPRNYIQMGSAHMDNAHGDSIAANHDTIATFDKTVLAKAVLHGAVFGTTGPLLDVHLDDKNMGETFTGKHATLVVTASSADWVTVDKLIVYVNGAVAKEQAIARNQRVEIPLVFDKDSFVVVEVSGAASADYKAVYPKFSPFAFSNPVFVDADGDGKWTAPGL